tara:strand:+ start:171 stop:530 length:360 start_codon:yes stop_codon:yes gene_type:complete
MRTLNDYFLKVTLPDCSASGSTGYVAVPDNGRIIKIIAVQEGAISGANAVINFKTATSGSSNVTGGTITIPYAGDAVGDVRYVEPTALNNVLEGEAIQVITNNASSGACPVQCTIVIRR